MAVSEVAEASTAPKSAAGKLHKQLGTFGCLLLALSCLSPVLSIFGIGSDVLQHAGSAAAPLFLIGIGVAVIWAVVYAELGSAYPYAGGDYVGVGSILGPWAAAITLAIWAATMGPQVAFQAKTIATYVIDVLPSAPGGLVTIAALAGAVGVALLTVRTGALVTGLFLCVELIAVVVLTVAGLLHPSHDPEAIIAHPLVAGPGGALIAPTFAALALAGVNTAYATVGGNQALYFGEELIEPHKNMGRVVVISCLVGAVCIAVPVIVVVLGAPDLAAVLRSPAPMAAFAAQTLGPAAGKALSACIALAIFNALIVQIMMGARLYFSLGRDAVFAAPVNRFLDRVDHRSGVPRRATLVLAVFSAVCCLISAHALLVFMNGLLVYAWGLVCLAVLIGRLRGLTGGPGFWRAPLGVLAPALGLALAVVFAVADIADPDAGRPSLLIMGAMVIAAVIWSRFVLERRPGGWTPSLVDHA
jgi:amino acid transporter